MPKQRLPLILVIAIGLSVTPLHVWNLAPPTSGIAFADNNDGNPPYPVRSTTGSQETLTTSTKSNLATDSQTLNSDKTLYNPISVLLVHLKLGETIDWIWTKLSFNTISVRQ